MSLAVLCLALIVLINESILHSNALICHCTDSESSVTCSDDNVCVLSSPYGRCYMEYSSSDIVYGCCIDDQILSRCRTVNRKSCRSENLCNRNVQQDSSLPPPTSSSDSITALFPSTNGTITNSDPPATTSSPPATTSSPPIRSDLSSSISTTGIINDTPTHQSHGNDKDLGEIYIVLAAALVVAALLLLVAVCTVAVKQWHHTWKLKDNKATVV